MRILLKSLADFYKDDGILLAIVRFLLVWLVYSFSIFLVGAELVGHLGSSEKKI